MGIRARMTMRCNTERDTPTSQRNPFNSVVTQANTAVLTEHPCYWQARTERFLADGGKLLALSTHLLLAPLGSDVKEQDKVIKVADRRGRILFGDKLIVKAAIPREDHLEVTLEAYS